MLSNVGSRGKWARFEGLQKSSQHVRRPQKHVPGGVCAALTNSGRLHLVTFTVVCSVARDVAQIVNVRLSAIACGRFQFQGPLRSSKPQAQDPNPSRARDPDPQP